MVKFLNTQLRNLNHLLQHVWCYNKLPPLPLSSSSLPPLPHPTPPSPLFPTSHPPPTTPTTSSTARQPPSDPLRSPNQDKAKTKKALHFQQFPSGFRWVPVQRVDFVPTTRRTQTSSPTYVHISDHELETNDGQKWTDSIFSSPADTIADPDL